MRVANDRSVLHSLETLERKWDLSRAYSPHSTSWLPLFVIQGTLAATGHWANASTTTPQSPPP
eukprot:1185368-Prorocentrum_minimum.AAC.2